MKIIQGILGVVLGIVIAVGPQTFLHVCGGGKMAESMGDAAPMAMSMPCQNVPAAALITGILIVIAGIVLLIATLKKAEGKAITLVLDLAFAISGIVTIGIPTFIVGVCQAPHMHCHAVTRPALIVLGAFVVVLAIAGFLRDLRKK